MFVKTDKANQIIQYPYTLDMFRAEKTNTSLPQALSNRFLAKYNVYPVYDAAKPDYDTINQYVVKVDQPHFDDTWKIGWEIKDKSAEQIAQELENYRIEFSKKIDAARNNAIYQTLEVAVNETTNIPVDIREDKPDIQNIAGLTQTATLSIINNDNTKIDFRGADNITYSLTPSEIVILGKAVSQKYSNMYAQSWVFKDALQSAVSIEEINAIEIAFN